MPSLLHATASSVTLPASAVSYTHLDVYKRQAPVCGFLPVLAALSDTSKVPNPTNWIFSPFFNSSATTSVTVSYTHLDVYKRQTTNLSGITKPT